MPSKIDRALSLLRGIDGVPRRRPLARTGRKALDPLSMTATVSSKKMASPRKRRRLELQSDEIDELCRLKRSEANMTFEIGTLKRQGGEYLQRIAGLMSTIEDLIDEQRSLKKQKEDADVEEDELAETKRTQRHLIMAYEQQTKEDEKTAASWTIERD